MRRVCSEYKLICDDHIHRNIVLLRIDRVQLCVSRGDSDRKRSARHRRKRSIVVAATIAQPEVSAVKADEGNDENVRRKDVAFARNWNIEHATLGTHAGMPLPELNWSVLGNDDGQRRLSASN